jgi:hypothetical protein
MRTALHNCCAGVSFRYFYRRANLLLRRSMNIAFAIQARQAVAGLMAVAEWSAIASFGAEPAAPRLRETSTPGFSPRRPRH